METFYYDDEILHSIHTSPTLKIEAEFEAVPFELKTFDKASVLRLLIKPDVADTDTIRDILKETR